jgi:hypothetical protein
MLQIIVALLLTHNVSSFTHVQPQTADTLEKAKKIVKIVKIIHGVK